MKEHIQDILVGGRPMTKLEQANKEIEYIKANAMFEGNVCCDDLYTSDCDKLIMILEGE